MELNSPKGAIGYLDKNKGMPLIITDFQVYEVPKFIATGSGPHYWGLLQKDFKNTLEVVTEISNELKLPLFDIGYAGLKDKRGKTTQWVSSPAPPPLQGSGWEIKTILRSQKKLKRGNLLGNWFIIETKEEIRNPPKIMPNFFGPQRFSKSNEVIGKLLIQKEKNQALKMMRELRIPINRKYFVLMEDAYTSYLFNLVLSKRLNHPELSGDIVTKKGVTGPIYGKKLNLATDAAGEIEKEVLEEEGLKLKDFPTEGKRRPLFVKPIGVETNSNTIRFFLPKGSYATIYLREISKETGITWNVIHPTSSSFV